MEKSDLLDTLRRLKPFTGTTHVNRLLAATGMESLERLAEFVEACQYTEWEDWLAHKISEAEECIPYGCVGQGLDGDWVESPVSYGYISAQHVGPEPERYTISQYWQTAGRPPVLTGQYQTNPAYWISPGHPSWEQHIADML